MTSRQRVVVAGAGFAGLGVARRLQDKVDVTVVAPTDRFTFLPIIHEVLSDSMEAREASKRVEDILPHAKIVYGRAQGVDGNDLVTAAGERIPFDKLVVAIGAESNDFGVPGVKEHALTFYSLGDALRANATLKAAAANKPDGEPVRVIVVGGSFTGIEVASEIAYLMRKITANSKILVLDALPEIFPRQSEAFREGVYEGLKRMNLEVRTGQKITEVKPGSVVVAQGEDEKEEIPADVVFWCAGVKPRSIQGVNPQVKPTLQSVDRDDIYFVGDSAQFPREAGVPKLAQTAEQMAPVAAYNLLNPDRQAEYKPEVKGLIVSIGPRYAVAEVSGKGVFTGRIPWHLKRQMYKAKIARL